ncbi:hypothetical protein L6164_026539 [Bauhinia variegata]|uniref:Uncharacterized protein n=1 Tax=Bauhinia variegata TaxID=167791 RepID=A0ACB9LQW8_BAUVA|nr:hypothetical protein L6164_026539 [Bauhinia variegata]
MGNSGSTNKIAIAAATAMAAIVAAGLCCLSSSSGSGSSPNSHDSDELNSLQSNSCLVSNSQDSSGSDSLLSSSSLVPNSQESGLTFDMPSGSIIGWQFPPIRWVKCNVDGSCRRLEHAAGCGGVYRDAQGKWVNCFARKLGYCSSMKAEILAIYTGLAEAWRFGF